MIEQKKTGRGGYRQNAGRKPKDTEHTHNITTTITPTDRANIESRHGTIAHGLKYLSYLAYKNSQVKTKTKCHTQAQ